MYRRLIQRRQRFLIVGIERFEQRGCGWRECRRVERPLPWLRGVASCDGAFLSFVQETVRSSRIILGDERRTLKQVGFGGGRFSWVCRF
jgi:hypothetical protein